MAKEKEVSAPEEEPKGAASFNNEQTIPVPIEQLQQILDRQKAQDEELATLRAAVNQGKLAEVENAKKPKELPKVFLKVFRGKIVVGWKTAAARYLYGTANQTPIGEVLQSVYNFIDGTDSGPVDQTEFTRSDTRVWARIQEGLRALQDPETKNVTLKFESLETNEEDLKRTFIVPTEACVIDKNFLNP